ncbi:hypothetical protein C8R46DRAFT_613354 [Mycena filopes]|nr:hypothetical protein C8R46DRAFT_613354 [Mycena filopes]
MLDVFAAHSQTWETINFIGLFEKLAPFYTITHELPLLKSLKLILHDTPNDDDAFGTMFQNAPLLRTVQLSSFGSQPHALPWAQLTSLHVQESASRDLVDILGRTLNLVHLVINGVYMEPGAPAFPPLPQLRSVVFLHPTSADQRAILLRLAAPLQMLRIAAWHCLCPPIPHSGSLEELWVKVLGDGYHAGGNTDGIDPRSLDAFLSMSSLRSLTLVLYGCNPALEDASVDPLIHRLAADLEFLPALESLTITLLEDPSNEPSTFDMVALSAMLKVRARRSGTSCQLRNFELRSRRTLTELDPAAAGQGMRIYLESSLYLQAPPTELYLNPRRSAYELPR